MKNKIISFILVLLIIGMLGVLGILGYIIYIEITEQGTLQITFEENTGFPTIEYIPSSNTGIIIDENLFDDTSDTQSIAGNNSVKSKYLYEQLDDTAKIIYKKLYEEKDNLKTGTYKVDFGNTFQTLLSQENGDKELKEQYQTAIEALVYENPDIFYLDVTKMYINIEKITKITGVRYNVYIDNGNEICYLTDGFYSKEDVEEYENKIEQIKNQIIVQIAEKDDYTKIKLVHDYLIDSIEYDDTLRENNIYDIYGALVNKKCVCEGYAKAFQYIMQEAGIETVIIIGTGTNSRNETESHAWNYVNLNNKWYAIDVTWDDPIISGGGILTNKSRYEYFLKGSQTMNENHVPSGRFTEKGKIFKYPELSIEDYE